MLPHESVLESLRQEVMPCDDTHHTTGPWDHCQVAQPQLPKQRVHLAERGVLLPTAAAVVAAAATTGTHSSGVSKRSQLVAADRMGDDEWHLEALVTRHENASTSMHVGVAGIRQLKQGSRRFRV